MQLKKYHRKRTPTINLNPRDPHFAPHGLHRRPSDYDQRNNVVAPPGVGSYCRMMMAGLP